MKTSQLVNILLVLAIIILSVMIVFFANNTSSSTDSSNGVIDNIMTRTSIRTYQDKPVEDEKVQLLLKAGMAAPTAVNKQPWCFIVVKKRELLQQLADSLPYAKMVAQAPLAIVVCGDLTKALPEEGYWTQDTSAATENILLAAHGLGLGAVWTGVYPRRERMKTVSEVLRLPRHIVPLNVIPVGYPAESPTPKDKWKPENVHYDGWNATR